MLGRWGAICITIAAAALSAVAGFTAKPLQRQPATGTLIPGQRSAAPVIGDDYDAVASDEALKTARRMAACVVKNHRKEITALVLANGKERMPQDLHRGMGFCMGNQNMESTSIMHLNGRMTLGLLAEAMLASSPPQPLPRSADAKDGGWAAGPGALDQTAACVAQTQPDRALALLTSAPATSGEASAFEGLMPALRDCIDPHRAFRADRVSVRLALALALFHRVYEPTPVATDLASKDTR